MSLGKHLLRGSGANVLDLVIKTVAMFITTPLMLRGLGQDGYGSWLLAMAVVGYFLMIDLGVTFSATRFLAVAVGSGDMHRQGVLLGATRRFFRVAGALIFICTLGAMPLVPWLTEQHHATSQIMLVLAIVGAATALKFSLRASLILLRAHVRYDLLAWASIGRWLCQTPAMCWVLTHDGGLIGAAAVHGTGECLELALQMLAARGFTWPSTGGLTADEAKKTRRELFAYSRSIVLGMIGDSVRQDMNPFLITKLRGLDQVPVYSLGMRLITILQDIVNAIFGGQVLAAFSHLHGANEKERLNSQFLRLTRITSGFSAAAVAGAAWMAEPFLRRWVGDALGPAHMVMLVLAIPYGMHFMQIPAYNLLYTLGKTDWVVKMCFFGGIVSGALSITLGLRWGIHGIVLGTGIEMLLARSVLMPWLVHLCTGIHPVGYMVRNVIWPGLKGALLPACYAIAARNHVQPEYPSILFHAAIYGVIFALGFPWLVMDKDARALLWNHLPFSRS